MSRTGDGLRLSFEIWLRRLRRTIGLISEIDPMEMFVPCLESVLLDVLCYLPF